MTLAICIECGHEKFGAFTPCRKCDHQPATLIDKAKSIMLSDHNFPFEELQGYSRTIKSGKTVLYDPVCLVIYAEPIVEENYYWEHLDDHGQLPCMRCRLAFSPAREEVLCPSCRSEIEPPLAICHRCPAVYEEQTRYCLKCGASLSFNPRVTIKAIAQLLAQSVRRILTAHDIFERRKFLAEIRSRLSTDDQAASEDELECLGLYVGGIAVANILSSTTIIAIRRETLELYRKSFFIRGINAEAADRMVEFYLKRFGEYDSIDSQGVPHETWLFRLSCRVVENCYGVGPHLGATIEMLVVMSTFGGSFAKVLTSMLSKHRVPYQTG